MRIAQKTTIMELSPYIQHHPGGRYIEFPENITSIEPFGLVGEYFTFILVPDGVVQIGRAAFLASKLTSISLPDSLKVIEDDAFCGCTRLKYLYFPKNLTHIGSRAFMGCDLIKEFVIPDTVEHIGDEAFAYCRRLKKVFLSEKTILGQDVFTYNHPKIKIEKYQKREDLPLPYSYS